MFKINDLVKVSSTYTPPKGLVRNFTDNLPPGIIGIVIAVNDRLSYGLNRITVEWQGVYLKGLLEGQPLGTMSYDEDELEPAEPIYETY